MAFRHWAPIPFAFMVAAQLAPFGEAGHGFNAQGVAVRDGNVFRVAFGAHLLRFQEPGTSGFGIILFRNDPAVGDLFRLEILEEANFLGRTNFIDADVAPNPVVVQTDYWAESTTPGVDFRLDGARATQMVLARGHYQEYEIVIGPTLL